MIWLFSIVFMPVPTAIITAYEASPGTVLLYIGTLVVTAGSLSMLALTVHRNPWLSLDRTPETREEVLGSSTAFVTLLLALVVGTLFSDRINYLALLLMLLSGPIEHLVKRRWATRAARAPGAAGP